MYLGSCPLFETSSTGQRYLKSHNDVTSISVYPPQFQAYGINPNRGMTDMSFHEGVCV